MGLKVGRIVKEFVFKSLLDHKVKIQIHANKTELTCQIIEVEKDILLLEVLQGDINLIDVEKKVRIFFFFQNNYHTFETIILNKEGNILKTEHPEGIYKNPQRKYERIKFEQETEIYFTLKGQKVELNFPKIEHFTAANEKAASVGDLDLSSIQHLHYNFKKKMSKKVSDSRITMFRNKIPKKYEEKVITALGKIYWIPSAEEDFPFEDPFPDERVITKRDLTKYEETFDRPAYVISSKLGNILYEKQKKRIYSELYCPILYDTYIIGYIYLVNNDDKREKISTELIDYVFQFSKVLCHSLLKHGYFSTENEKEQRYEASIIDISASGLLFAYPSEELAKNLLLQTDIDITLKIADRKMVIGSRIQRKFKDSQYSYFGIQFLKIDPENLEILFLLLYGKPFTPEEEEKWEGGTPPPELNLFEN